MRSKILFAALLCAVTILAGCSEATGSSDNSSSTQSSSESISSESEYNSSSTESSSSEAELSSYSSSSTTSSSSKTTSSSSKANKKVYAKIIPRINGLLSTNGKWTFDFQLSDKDGDEFLEENAVSKTNCTVYVYASDSPDSIGTVIQKKIIPENADSSYNFCFDVKLWETIKYIRIKVVGKDFTSEISDYFIIHPKEVPTPDIPRYTHTFTAPSYLTVIPDYSEALAEIERGEEPDSFSISVQFTCPSCGKSRNIPVWLVEFPYSRDGEMPFNVKCLWSNCPYNKLKNELHATIESHAVRIS